MVDSSHSKLIGAVVLLGLVTIVVVGAIAYALPGVIDSSPAPHSPAIPQTEQPSSPVADNEVAPPRATGPSPRLDSGSDAVSTPHPPEPPNTGQFEFTVTRIEPCGTKCRLVTATLSNNRAHAVHNVAVETQLAAGGTSLYTAHKRIGTLHAGASVTLTTRVTIGVRDAFALKATNGQVTMTTIIMADTGRRVITIRRDIA